MKKVNKIDLLYAALLLLGFVTAFVTDNFGNLLIFSGLTCVASSDETRLPINPLNIGRLLFLGGIVWSGMIPGGFGWTTVFALLLAGTFKQ